MNENVFDPFDPEEANEEISYSKTKSTHSISNSANKTQFYSLLLAPRRDQGDLKGFVAMEWGMDDDRVIIANINPMGKKDGTRVMLLGSTHAMIVISKERFPHLQSFVLQDEATCSIQHDAYDLFLHDETYFERCLNMEPVLERIKFAKQAILSRINARISRRKPFDSFWKSLTNKRDDESEKLSWLLDNMIGIHEDYEISYTWRDFFIKMHHKYSGEFFAACGNQLFRIFRMSSMLGKQYIVKFEDLPKLSCEISLVSFGKLK